MPGQADHSQSLIMCGLFVAMEVKVQVRKIERAKNRTL